MGHYVFELENDLASKKADSSWLWVTSYIVCILISTYNLFDALVD